MSELMQIFLNDLGISHIRTSLYHPQTNVACEWFNGTLKKMLMDLTDQFPDTWDETLPWVLFAYRDVPVETLGCSPFDLFLADQLQDRWHFWNLLGYTNRFRDS